MSPVPVTAPSFRWIQRSRHPSAAYSPGE